MARFNQMDLIRAHQGARQNAHEQTLSGDPSKDAIEAPSNPQPFEDVEHPFSGNRNNQRVAERLAATKMQTTAPEAPKTPQDAASDDLSKAAAYEAEHPELFVDTEDDSSSLAAIRAGLDSGRLHPATLLPPLVGDANVPGASSNVLPEPPASPTGSAAPPPPPPPPAFQG